MNPLPWHARYIPQRVCRWHRPYPSRTELCSEFKCTIYFARRRRNKAVANTPNGKNGSLDTKGKQILSLYEIVSTKSEIKLQEKQENLEQELFPGHKNELNWAKSEMQTIPITFATGDYAPE